MQSHGIILKKNGIYKRGLMIVLSAVVANILALVNTLVNRRYEKWYLDKSTYKLYSAFL